MADLLLRASIRRGGRGHPNPRDRAARPRFRPLLDSRPARAAGRARPAADRRAHRRVDRRPGGGVPDRPDELTLGAAHPLDPARDAVVGAAVRGAVHPARERRGPGQPRLAGRDPRGLLAVQQSLRRAAGGAAPAHREVAPAPRNGGRVPAALRRVRRVHRAIDQLAAGGLRGLRVDGGDHGRDRAGDALHGAVWLLELREERRHALDAGIQTLGARDVFQQTVRRVPAELYLLPHRSADC